MICLAFAAISLADGLRAPARLPEAPADDAGRGTTPDDASGHDLPRAGAGRAAASFLRLANASDSASVTADAAIGGGGAPDATLFRATLASLLHRGAVLRAGLEADIANASHSVEAALRSGAAAGSRLPAMVKHFSGLLCLESQLASQSLRLVDGPSFEQKQGLSTIPLFLLGKAHVRLGDDRQIGVIIGVGSCCLVLLIVIVYWATRRQGTPMRPEPRSYGQLLGMTSFRFYAGMLMCTWVPFLLVEEGDNLWSGHQVAFMGIGKAILAFSMLLTPIIGIINDETISYLGRRRFWFISGVILIAIGVLTCAVASLKRLPVVYLLGVAGWCTGEAFAESTTEALIPDLCLPEDYDRAAALRGLLFMVGGLVGYALVILSSYVLDWDQTLFYPLYMAVVMISAPPMIYYACPTDAEKLQYDTQAAEPSATPALPPKRNSVPGDSSAVEDFDSGEKQRSYFHRGYVDCYNASPIFSVVSIVTTIVSASTGSLLFINLTIRDVIGIEDFQERQLQFALVSGLMLLTASITSVILGATPIQRENRIPVICWFIAINGVLEVCIPLCYFVGDWSRPRLIALYIVGGVKGFAFGGMYNLMQPLAWDSIPESWKRGLGAVSRANSFISVCRSVGIGIGNIIGSLILELTYYVREHRPTGPVRYPVHGYIIVYALSLLYCAVAVFILLHLIHAKNSGSTRYAFPYAAEASGSLKDGALLPTEAPEPGTRSEAD